MAYDRYDTRDAPRDERSRWSDDRSQNRNSGSGRSGHDDRGFFERASDEVSSWFGDEDAERRHGSCSSIRLTMATVRAQFAASAASCFRPARVIE